jgi:2-polyprenyl-3-methyl-5-hydroxy-6-metoxy-1,4-benzoquinol methylase
MISQHICPACRTPVANGNGRRILHCRSCGHRWMWTSEVEQQEIEQAVYTDEYAGYRADPVFEQGIRSLLDGEIVPRLPEEARILDVGCGSGDFLAAAKERGLRPKGIDVSEDGARKCREKGFDAISGNFLTDDLGEGFDAVTMWDVIEHLRDPGEFFERVQEVLRPGGLFIGKVPAFGPISVELSRQVPRLAGMLLGAPDHVQYFTQGSLDMLLRSKGFEVEWLRPRANKLRGKRRGGSIKRRAGRLLASSIKGVSGDENLYFVATPKH